MRHLFKTAAAAAVALSTSLAALPAFAETLTFVSWMKGEPGYGDWWNEVIQKFEASHPDVKVEMTKVSRNEYADTMFTMFAGGTPPDIVHLAAFEYQAFANEGWLADLGPFIEKSGMDLKGWAGQSTCEWKGKTNCIMLLYTAYILAYNEKLLKDAGIASVPTDWNGLIAAAKAATRDTDGDGVTDVYGLGVDSSGGSNMMHDMLHFVLDAGGNWTEDGKPAFNSPGVIEGLARFKQIYKDGLTPKDAKAGDMRQLLIEGRIAMRLDGPWIWNVMKGADPAIRDNLKLAESPLNPPVGGTSNVIGMPSDISDEKKALVWDFIQVAASKEMQQRFATLGSSPAPMPGLDYTAEIKADPNFALFAKANDKASAAGVDRLPKGLELQFNEVTKIVFREVQRMLIDDLSPQEAGANMQAAVEKIAG
ncbi:sugar ABC transporter substrate-binding protein [Rhizobium sp. SSA_523]|uniref:ABC transporter substrate-binding protein n=1 Tax=Rhizobium sp. SSA_523 TaxID=2952477 RepID=UPI00209187D8|nr:sugar ABC transporter substrate-binding protein [Rhizobium sp. SSA_523]MCO5732197.1 sugar ABC transporter substrate-binding protein [Rhizobium sp. SSA_523]WKC21389.1 sugar ABC transporter substrate-binding protein [Rhizobium sp. SSA_523]